MKNLIILISAIVLVLSSCEPRIELDYGQWGDKAFLTNVQVFRLDINEEAQLVEWQNNQQYVTGTRRIIISAGTADIDQESAIATVRIPSAQIEHLNAAGLVFFHYGTLIEPLENSPKAGIPSDLSAKSFKYRVHSADGTKRDWDIYIIEI